MPRTVMKIAGADAEAFLQRLVTNDVARDGLVYAALLTPQGKYIADFFLLRGDSGFLLDVDAGLAEDLERRLSMYRLRADVQIAESGIAVARGSGPAPPGAHADPRHAALGWRLYGDADAQDGTDFDAVRVAHCIPESGIELTPDTYILEAGFERLAGVDFSKGCYVGQEVTARMKHKTSLRKGLAIVEVAGDAPLGAEITADGKAAGRLFTRSGDRAIAHLRFDRADGEMSAGAARVRLAAGAAPS